MNQPSTEKCQFNFHLPLLLLGGSGNGDGDDRDIGNGDRSVGGDIGNENGDSVDRDGNGLGHNYQQIEREPHPYLNQLLREGGSTGNRAFEALNTWLAGAQALADRELDDELFNSVFQVIFGLNFPSPHLPSFRHYWGEQSDRKRQFYQPAIPHLPIPRALAAHLEVTDPALK